MKKFIDYLVENHIDFSYKPGFSPPIEGNLGVYVHLHVHQLSFDDFKFALDNSCRFDRIFASGDDLIIEFLF